MSRFDKTHFIFFVFNCPRRFIISKPNPVITWGFFCTPKRTNANVSFSKTSTKKHISTITRFLLYNDKTNQMNRDELLLCLAWVYKESDSWSQASKFASCFHRWQFETWDWDYYEAFQLYTLVHSSTNRNFLFDSRFLSIFFLNLATIITTNTIDKKEKNWHIACWCRVYAWALNLDVIFVNNVGFYFDLMYVHFNYFLILVKKWTCFNNACACSFTWWLCMQIIYSLGLCLHGT